MKISVAMCTCCASKFIRQQFDSICTQTILPSEIIVCDDNSDDNTLEILRDLSKKYKDIDIQIIANEYRLGVVKNFEQAILKCTGDIICLSDQDDIWMPNKIKVIENYFSQNIATNVLFTNAELINEYGNLFVNKTLFDIVNFNEQSSVFFDDGFALELFNIDNRATGATMAVRKNYIHKIFPFVEEKGILHDEFIAVSAIVDNCLGYLNDCLIRYRIHSNQIVGFGNWFNKAPDNNVFKNILIKPQYKAIIETNENLVNKVIFIEKRHDLIKHLLGLFMIIGNIRKYRTTYSKYACKTLKNDIYDFFKINALRIKKILYA